jgi:hypothetical protein
MPIFRQVFLPYALQKLGNGWFMPMNREYKPLGPEVRIKVLTAARAEKIGLRDVGGHYYYLYDDATQPQSSAANWRRYEQILEKLMRMEVEEDDGKSRRRRQRRYVETTHDHV